MKHRDKVMMMMMMMMMTALTFTASIHASLTEFAIASHISWWTFTIVTSWCIYAPSVVSTGSRDTLVDICAKINN